MQGNSVRIGALQLIHSIVPHFYARFCPDDLAVVVIQFQSPLEIKDAIVQGRIDFGVLGVAAAIIGAANGEPVTVVASCCHRGMAVIARASSSIASLGDLRGHRVGLFSGSAQEVLFLERLRMEGLSIGDVQAVPMPFGAMAEALARGEIDAYVGAEPGPATSLLNRSGRLVEYPYGTALGALNMVLATHADLVAKRPDLCRTVMDMHARASAWAADNSAAVVEGAAEILGQSPAVLDIALANVEFTATMGFSTTRQAKLYAGYMLELRKIPRLPDFERLFWDGTVGPAPAAADGGSWGLAVSRWLSARSLRTNLIALLLAQAVSMGAAVTAALASSLPVAVPVLLALTGMAITLLGIVYTVVELCRPLARMTDRMVLLSRRDYGAIIPGQHRGDEIGRMANAVTVFRDAMQEGDQVQAGLAEEQRRKEARQSAVGRAISEFDATLNTALETLSDSSSDLEATASAVSTIAEAVNRQTGIAQDAGAQTVGNVEVIAAATSTLLRSVDQILVEVAHSAAIANRASAEADHTVHQVEVLARSSARIQDIVNLIQGIAGRTNLLALNATIEAMRAGERGAGFAVVAQEVKELSRQTAKATLEIDAQIRSIQQETALVVEAIHTIGLTIREMTGISGKVARTMGQQGEIMRDIAHHVSAVTVETRRTTDTISAVTAQAGEMNQATATLLNSAGHLVQQENRLKSSMASFFVLLRSA